MKINLDEGYSFGLGLFETILLYKKRAIFLDEHIKRLNSSLRELNICTEDLKKEEVINFIEKNKEKLQEKEVLKIIISEKNRIFLTRKYNYTIEDYQKGFYLNISKVLKNQTSPLIYHKTLNYGDNILEKRKSLSLGYDETIFLNLKGEITEGATSNIFFIKGNKIYTPKLSCGMLNGIIRQYILKNYEVFEEKIKLEDLENFEEAFITNSLLGIMPVNSIEKVKMKNRKFLEEIKKKYFSDIEPN